MPRIAWIGGAAFVLSIGVAVAALVIDGVSYFSPLERCVRQVEQQSHTDDAVARGQCKGDHLL
jgi:hypothetical protein